MKCPVVVWCLNSGCVGDLRGETGPSLDVTGANTGSGKLPKEGKEGPWISNYSLHKSLRTLGLEIDGFVFN